MAMASSSAGAPGKRRSPTLLRWQQNDVTYRKAPVTGNEAVGQLVDHDADEEGRDPYEIVDEQARGRLPAGRQDHQYHQQWEAPVEADRHAPDAPDSK